MQESAPPIGEHFDVRLLRPRRRPLLLLLCAIRQNDGARARALKLERSCTRHTHTLSNYIYISHVLYIRYFSDASVTHGPKTSPASQRPKTTRIGTRRPRHASATPPPRLRHACAVLLCGACDQPAVFHPVAPVVHAACARCATSATHLRTRRRGRPARGKEGGGCVRVTARMQQVVHAAAPQPSASCATHFRCRVTARQPGLSTCWRPSHSRACRQI